MKGSGPCLRRGRQAPPRSRLRAGGGGGGVGTRACSSTLLAQGGQLLQEAAEGSQARAGAHHDHRLRQVLGQPEAGPAQLRAALSRVGSTPACAAPCPRQAQAVGQSRACLGPKRPWTAVDWPRRGMHADTASTSNLRLSNWQQPGSALATCAQRGGAPANEQGNVAALAQALEVLGAHAHVAPSRGSRLIDVGACHVHRGGMRQGAAADGVEACLQARHDRPKERPCAQMLRMNRVAGPCQSRGCPAGLRATSKPRPCSASR